jgi:hypothetical protein
MMGEELDKSQVSDRGLLGDRSYALLDLDTRKVVSAKNPRKWAKLFDFRASLLEPPNPGGSMPAAQITFPDGTVASSDEPDVDGRLSEALGARVQLLRSSPPKPVLEEYWPDIEGLAYRDRITDESMPPGTFFDSAVVHLLTTATLDRLRDLNAEGRFEVRRFRPNIVIEPSPAVRDFVENGWIDRTLRLGDEIRLKVTRLCMRCVMTTLPQGDLPRDLSILRTTARHNHVNVGAYASVECGGSIARGDRIWVE